MISVSSCGAPTRPIRALLENTISSSRDHDHNCAYHYGIRNIYIKTASLILSNGFNHQFSDVRMISRTYYDEGSADVALMVLGVTEGVRLT